jgi:CBS domain-containing protein
MGTTVSSILKHKGHDVVTVAPQQTVTWVVEVLAQNRIGAVPVVNQEGQLIGIVSERDIIRGMSQHAEAVLTLPADADVQRPARTTGRSLANDRLGSAAVEIRVAAEISEPERVI